MDDGDILGTRKNSKVHDDGDILGTRKNSKVHDDGDILGTRKNCGVPLEVAEGTKSVEGESPVPGVKKPKVEKPYDNSNRRVPVETLTPDQFEKYKIWKSSTLDPEEVESSVLSGFSRGFVESLGSGHVGGCLSEKCLKSVEAATRMFLGDIIETSIKNRGFRDPEIPLRTSEVHEAWSEVCGKSKKKFGAI